MLVDPRAAQTGMKPAADPDYSRLEMPLRPHGDPLAPLTERQASHPPTRARRNAMMIGACLAALGVVGLVGGRLMRARRA